MRLARGLEEQKHILHYWSYKNKIKSVDGKKND